MNIDAKTFQDLGFEETLQSIRAYALSSEGADAISGKHLLFEKREVAERQTVVDDLSYIASKGINAQLEAFPDISATMDALEEGMVQVLPGEEIYDIAVYLRSASLLKSFTQTRDNDFMENPAYSLLEPYPAILDKLRNSIFDVLQSPGKVKDSHPAIRALKKEIEKKRGERASFTSQFCTANSGLINGESAVMRDMRIVIPVKNECRSEVNGFIHSSSSSGQTVFIEPFRLVELNNAVAYAQQQIEVEIAKILGELTSLVKAAEGELRLLRRQVAKADMLLAFSRWAAVNNCCRTNLDGETLYLLNARHPLLKKSAVPITLKLEDTTKALVLSGPNAGGKTVTIKTVGLFVLLNQLAGYIPAAEGSSLPVFKNVISDIGDEQSIQNALSTFSAHMKRIAYMMDCADSETLLIMDELGSGTDPVEGAAIARAVMEYSVRHAGLTLVTSHHDILKQYAYAASSVQNASMEFDEKTFLPTFRVITGIPGTSHAIDTAKRMKMSPEVIKLAQGYMSAEALEISNIIKGLEQRRIEADKREAELRVLENELKLKLKETDELSKRLTKEEFRLAKEGIADLETFRHEASSQLENLVKEIRTGEISREKIKKKQDYIEGLKAKEADAKKANDKRKADIIAREIAEKDQHVEFKEGMEVLCGPSKREGVIEKPAGKGRWTVMIGNMRMNVDESKLSLPRRSAEKSYSLAYSLNVPAPKPVMDLRGYTLAEALEAIDRQIESCLVHTLLSFSIIHGFGDGILSKGIHAYFRTNRFVKNYYYAAPEDGGQGKTYVEL